MVYEFEGRSEKEAIDAAAEELGLERDGLRDDVGSLREIFARIAGILRAPTEFRYRRAERLIPTKLLCGHDRHVALKRLPFNFVLAYTKIAGVAVPAA